MDTGIDAGPVAPESKRGQGESWLVEYLKYSVTEMRLNRVITAVGPPGSGKSWTGLRIGSLCDPLFGIERVVFPGLDYIRAVANPELTYGSLVLWGDAGVGGPPRGVWALAHPAGGGHGGPIVAVPPPPPLDHVARQIVLGRPTAQARGRAPSIPPAHEPRRP